MDGVTGVLVGALGVLTGQGRGHSGGGLSEYSRDGDTQVLRRVIFYELTLANGLPLRLRLPPGRIVYPIHSGKISGSQAHRTESVPGPVA